MLTCFEQGGNQYRLPPPIKVIPTTASVRSFSGTDNDFPATEFITLCENMIKGLSIADDSDKIPFIRSRLVPGSRAINLMQSRAFRLTDISSDHEQFKRNFLKVSRDGGRESLVKQVSHTVDTFLNKAASWPIWDGLVGAHQLANDCIKSLKDYQMANRKQT